MKRPSSHTQQKGERQWLEVDCDSARTQLTWLNKKRAPRGPFSTTAPRFGAHAPAAARPEAGRIFRSASPMNAAFARAAAAIPTR